MASKQWLFFLLIILMGKILPEPRPLKWWLGNVALYWSPKQQFSLLTFIVWTKKIFFMLVLIVMSDMFELIFTSIFFPAKEHLKPWSQGVCARGEILGIIIVLLSHTRIWSYMQRLLCPCLGWSHKCALLHLLKGQEYRNTEFFIFLNGRWFVYKFFFLICINQGY